MSSKAARAWSAHQTSLGDRLREYREAWQCLPALVIEPAKSAADLINQLLPPQNAYSIRS